MINLVGNSEEIVREVIGLDYNQFGFANDQSLVDDIVDVIDGTVPPIMFDGTLVSTTEDPAKDVANLLYIAYGGKYFTATCNLFLALGRENELGIIAKLAKI